MLSQGRFTKAPAIHLQGEPIGRFHLGHLCLFSHWSFSYSGVKCRSDNDLKATLEGSTCSADVVFYCLNPFRKSLNDSVDNATKTLGSNLE